MRAQQIAKTSELAEGTTAKFTFVRGGKSVEGFVARFQGRLIAYENKCRHLPLTLDYADNRFFDSTGAHFVCQTHGAVFNPTDGLCVRGPCEGASLFPLEVEESRGVVWLLSAEPQS